MAGRYRKRSLIHRPIAYVDPCSADAGEDSVTAKSWVVEAHNKGLEEFKTKSLAWGGKNSQASALN